MKTGITPRTRARKTTKIIAKVSFDREEVALGLMICTGSNCGFLTNERAVDEEPETSNRPQGVSSDVSVKSTMTGSLVKGLLMVREGE